jgi:hypothetical protein
MNAVTVLRCESDVDRKFQGDPPDALKLANQGGRSNRPWLLLLETILNLPFVRAYRKNS